MYDGPMGDSDPFRFCIYCAADCYEEDPEHADDCPSTTGVFPVTKRMLVSISAEGELEHSGMRCMDCEDSFAAGDHYTHRHVGRGALAFGIDEDASPADILTAALAPGMEEADVYEIICLGCAALEALAA